MLGHRRRFGIFGDVRSRRRVREMLGWRSWLND